MSVVSNRITRSRDKKIGSGTMTYKHIYKASRKTVIKYKEYRLRKLQLEHKFDKTRKNGMESD